MIYKENNIIDYDNDKNHKHIVEVDNLISLETWLYLKEAFLFDQPMTMIARIVDVQDQI